MTLSFELNKYENMTRKVSKMCLTITILFLKMGGVPVDPLGM